MLLPLHLGNLKRSNNTHLVVIVCHIRRFHCLPQARIKSISSNLESKEHNINKFSEKKEEEEVPA